MGSMSTWQLAQTGSDSCWANRSRVEVAAVGGGGVVFTLGGGEPMKPQSRLRRTSFPRCTGEVWLLCDHLVRNAAWVRIPARWVASSATGDPTENPGGCATP